MPPKKSGKSKGKKKSKPVSAKNQIAGDSSLSSEQVAELKKTFGAFSKGKGGQLRLDQVGVAMRAAGGVPTETELNNILGELVNVDKASISFIEFCEIIAEHRNKHGFLDQELKEAFEVFDENKDGQIETAELMKILTAIGDPLTDKEADELIKEADLNGDGKINYIEFVGMTCRPV